MADPYANANSPRCDECPLTLLDDYLKSPEGELVNQTISLDFALQAGVTITLKEISYPEFLRLRLLTEERNKFHEETMKKSTRKHGG